MTKEQVNNLLKAVFEDIDDDTDVKVVDMTKHTKECKVDSDAIKSIAKINKEIYDAHINAGFSEEQAFIILTNMVKMF